MGLHGSRELAEDGSKGIAEGPGVEPGETTDDPAAAPNAPAVAVRKNRSGLVDATPRWHATSTPRASAVRKSRPPTRPSRSAHARAAATGTVKVWTTAPSCTQSNSALWIWYALHTAAPAAERRAPCDQTRA